MISNQLPLVSRLADLQAKFRANSQQLGEWSEQGGCLPSASVADSFRIGATELDDLTLALLDVHPDRQELLQHLKVSTLKLARDGGQLTHMVATSVPFGPGWGQALDQPLQAAAMALEAAGQAGSGAAVAAPDPLVVIPQLAELHQNLGQWDSRLTQWQAEPPAPPIDSELAQTFGQLASQVYDARNSLRALRPEQAPLIQALGANSRWIASKSGQLDTMFHQGHTFAEGWAEALDPVIENVHQAQLRIAGS